MWNNVLIAVVLVAFAGLQFANSLTCYSCNTPDSCNYPSIQTCNNATANANSNWLSTIHSNVPRVSGSNNFRCINITYYFSSNRVVKAQEIKGCYHPSIQVCSLAFNGTQGSAWENDCSSCDRDRCNGNPAGSFSRSTYTIMTSAMALILAKLLH